MRPIDADCLVQQIEGWQDQLAATYGQNDEYVLCLGEVLMKIDDAPTIPDMADCTGDCDGCRHKKRVPGDIDRIDREPRYFCDYEKEV